MLEADNYTLRMMQARPFNWTYREPIQVYPFSFEKIDIFWWHSIPRDNWKFALYAGVIYIVTIFGLQRRMRNRPPMELKKPLFWWNFTLGVFSIFGFARTAPGLLISLSEPNGFYNSICKRTGLDVPTTCWVMLFGSSKLFELGDTVFIVLRKRPLIFLQWYHHLVTMSAVWILSPILEPINRWAMVLNFGVHSLMYPYFALKALDYKVSAKFANLVTTLQLAQMIIAFAINIISIYYKKTGEDCSRADISIKVFVAIYASFIVLFGKLFYESVLKSGRRKNKSGDDDDDYKSGKGEMNGGNSMKKEL